MQVPLSTVGGKYFEYSLPSEEVLRVSDYSKVMQDQSSKSLNPGFTRVFTHSEKTKNCCNDLAVKKLIEETKASSPELHQILVERSINSIKQTLRSDMASDLLVPNADALALIASKYKQKYDIDIFVESNCGGEPVVLSASWFGATLQKEIEDKTPRCKGMIFNPNGDIGHAIPLLFKMENNEAKVLVLDVLGKNPAIRSSFYLLGIFCSLGISFCQCEDQRQADDYSCRMGALITLRNALLSIKDGNPTALEPFQHCRTHSGELDEHAAVFNMPAEWGGANDQIFRPKDSVKHLMNPRQKHSKRTEKRLESLLESRMHHNRDLPFKYEYELSLDNSNIDLSGIQLPDGLKVSQNSGEICFEWSSTKKVNAYFFVKGAKEDAKIEVVKKLFNEL